MALVSELDPALELVSDLLVDMLNVFHLLSTVFTKVPGISFFGCSPSSVGLPGIGSPFSSTYTRSRHFFIDVFSITIRQFLRFHKAVTWNFSFWLFSINLQDILGFPYLLYPTNLVIGRTVGV